MARKESRSRGGARPRRIRLVERWRSWRRHHSQSAADSLAGVLRQPVASVMTWLVIGIAIALPSGLWVVLDNIARDRYAAREPGAAVVFLADGVDRRRARRWRNPCALARGPCPVRFLDRDSALAEFVEHSGMGDLAASLPENPLPHLLLILPRTIRRHRWMHSARSSRPWPEVQEVVLDTLWLRRLESLMALGRRAVQLLAGLLLLAVVLVLGQYHSPGYREPPRRDRDYQAGRRQRCLCAPTAAVHGSVVRSGRRRRGGAAGGAGPWFSRRR
jgi:cell division transport system permease protein